MTMKRPKIVVDQAAQEKRSTPTAVAEEILEKKLEDIATILCKAETDKNRIYEEIMTMVERSLVRIALRRSHNVKSAAAYLGINRNTFQKKMVNLGIHNDSE